MKHAKTFLLILIAVSMESALSAKKITGTVYGKDGLPKSGIFVWVKGTIGISASTDLDGKYTIEANPGDTLVFSFYGMGGQEILVGEQNVIDVYLDW